ncbi:MAG: hypothetical protein HC772_01825 [Leptolyngbyaceae cyanobacterium CRU_2_3]|nr:hypothetical protein [Leptolyngbyaceae cyanobacterium CRU_2_3]
MNPPGYASRTPSYYLQSLEPEMLNSFSSGQLQAVQSLLRAAIPQPTPKIVDLRFGIDLLFSRFYMVLFVGKDRRRQRRQYLPERVSRFGNAIAAILLLISINLVISLMIFMFAYLVKSALGIDLTPGHLVDQLDRF